MSYTIRELPDELKPRERLLFAGATALSNAELLSLLIGSGGENRNAIQVAEDLLVEHKSLFNLTRLRSEELQKTRHIGEAKAAILLAAFELVKRIGFSLEAEQQILRTPADIADLVMAEMTCLETEQLRILMLDTKNKLVGVHTAYSGSLNTCVIRIGEIIREPIRRGCAAFILCHNHPSGDPTPSPEDLRVTEMVKEAAELIDINLIDHIVIGRNRYVSMRERGIGGFGRLTC